MPLSPFKCSLSSEVVIIFIAGPCTVFPFFESGGIFAREPRFAPWGLGFCECFDVISGERGGRRKSSGSWSLDKALLSHNPPRLPGLRGFVHLSPRVGLLKRGCFKLKPGNNRHTCGGTVGRLLSPVWGSKGPLLGRNERDDRGHVRPRCSLQVKNCGQVGETSRSIGNPVPKSQRTYSVRNFHIVTRVGLVFSCAEWIR